MVVGKLLQIYEKVFRNTRFAVDDRGTLSAGNPKPSCNTLSKGLALVKHYGAQRVGGAGIRNPAVVINSHDKAFQPALDPLLGPPWKSGVTSALKIYLRLSVKKTLCLDMHLTAQSDISSIELTLPSHGAPVELGYVNT